MPLLCFAENSSCPKNIAGETQHWMIVVCEMRAGSDKFDNVNVQKCIFDLVEKDGFEMLGPPDCKLNEKYKKEWCQTVVDWNPDKTLRACMKSTKNIPAIVVEGGV
jgi:hypothetical protein